MPHRGQVLGRRPARDGPATTVSLRASGPPARSWLPAPRPGREGRNLLLANGTSEQAAADRRFVEAREKAHGAADIRSHAEEVRARLVTNMRRE